MDKAHIRGHFEDMAAKYDGWKARNAYYYDTLKAFFGRLLRPEDRVIEFGCGTGDILAAAPGREKLGLDLAQAMVDRARQKHPELRFEQHDAELPLPPEAEGFDAAILADIIDHVTDILKLYGTVNQSLKVGGRMVLTTINPLWDPIFNLAEKFGMKMPEGEHNFVPMRDLIAFLKLRGFREVKHGALLLLPKRIPLISGWINRIAPHLPLIRRFCVVQTLVAEKVADWREDAWPAQPTVSVIIPCYNEEGNIAECIRRVPDMGAGTEIVVVNDGSPDRTATIVRDIATRDSRVRLIDYSPNRGKGKAVQAGFEAARNDILMILDADMTVMPEELPLFVRALADEVADFANGTRMIYPMEQQAMRFANLIGNFAFGMTVSWLLGQRVSDTLCGTKAFWRRDYARIPMGGDKWGDFDLLFGAAENRLRIADVPIHYKARVAGESKMKPLKHTLVLLKVCWKGFWRMKVFRRV